MTWSWSHTNEAYAAARDNLGRLPLETLREIMREWAAYQPEGDDSDFQGFSESAYAAAVVDVDIPADVLADAIWERASDFAACDNGGWSAWMCPYGCGCHTVSFSLPDES